MNITSLYTQPLLAICTGLLPPWGARIHPRRMLLLCTLIEVRMENHYLSEVLGDALLNETRGTSNKEQPHLITRNTGNKK